MENRDSVSIRLAVVEAVMQVLRKKDVVLDDNKLFSDLGLDDLDKFELVLKIEDAFNLEISDDDTCKLVSIAETVSYVAARKSV